MFRLTIPILMLALLCGCNGGVDKNGRPEGYDECSYKPAEATGFTIDGNGDNRLIVTSESWQGNENSKPSYVLIDRGEGVPEGFTGAVVNDQAKRIVAMSSTHVAMLEAIGAADRIVGVSGIDYISSPTIVRNRQRITDVGPDTNVDFEQLVMLDPDLVLLYGVDGPSPLESKLRELEIPFMYVGDYLEQSPLGKAEWMVALGEVTGRREVAEKEYLEITGRYVRLRDSIASLPAAGRPKVMLNAPYGDSWFLPPADSYMVRLIEDAGGEYLYAENRSGRSVPVDMETAFMLTSEADFWLNCGSASSLEQLRNAVPHLASLPLLNTPGRVFNNTRLTNAHGGNDFYESGTVRPDLILRDLITILHSPTPSLSATDSSNISPDTTASPLTYYLPLQ